MIDISNEIYYSNINSVANSNQLKNIHCWNINNRSVTLLIWYQQSENHNRCIIYSLTNDRYFFCFFMFKIKTKKGMVGTLNNHSRDVGLSKYTFCYHKDTSDVFITQKIFILWHMRMKTWVSGIFEWRIF